MVGRLAGRTAVVTGIGSGIGRGCALRFAAEGATVIGTDISAPAAERTVAAAEADGLVIASVHPVDLTDSVQVDDLFATIGADHDAVDVLVNAGAIQPHMAATADMDFASAWRPTIAGEIDVVFLACRAAWPLLVASGSASIINFASVNAHRGSRQMGMVAHAAGKGAVLAMTRQLAIDGGPSGIRANTISPGLVRTDATAAAGATGGQLSDAIVARTLLGRLGVPDDIAWCATYLASTESSWVTGSDFRVDGGVTAA